jgi:glycosyltransferase involved in cell wall biosynthesis
MPLISVIIPAYNAERWLPETLASVAAQEWPDLEVIVVDDGSTDGTAVFVEQAYPQWTLHRSENRGVSQARNLGTQSANGEFVQYLDADDLLLPGKLARQVALLQANPKADIVYSNWQRLNAQPNGQFEPGDIMARTIAEVNHDAEIAFFTSMWCPTGAYLYRRSFLDRVLPWKEWLPVIQDARFALDCAMSGARWLHDPTVSILYRQHQAGSVSTRNKLAFVKDCLANTEDVEKLWSLRGQTTPARRATLLSSYANLARSFFALDRPTFDSLHRKLMAMDPHFLPSGRALALLTRIIGYANAEQVALWYRQLRARVFGSASRY